MKIRQTKTCWNCKHRDLDMSLKPCSECDEFTHNKWEPREQ